jgi:hypothetical protein
VVAIAGPCSCNAVSECKSATSRPHGMAQKPPT